MAFVKDLQIGKVERGFSGKFWKIDKKRLKVIVGLFANIFDYTVVTYIPAIGVIVNNLILMILPSTRLIALASITREIGLD